MKARNSIFKIFVIYFAFSLVDCATFKSEIKGRFDSTVGKNYGADGVSVFFVFSHLSQTKGYNAIPKLDNKRQRIRG